MERVIYVTRNEAASVEGLLIKLIFAMLIVDFCLYFNWTISSTADHKESNNIFIIKI